MILVVISLADRRPLHRGKKAVAFTRPAITMHPRFHSTRRVMPSKFVTPKEPELPRDIALRMADMIEQDLRSKVHFFDCPEQFGGAPPPPQPHPFAPPESPAVQPPTIDTVPSQPAKKRAAAPPPPSRAPLPSNPLPGQSASPQPSQPTAPRSPSPETNPESPQADQPLPRQEKDLRRHSSRCTVCCHPERHAIEQEFLHWYSTDAIAAEFSVSRDALYRHMHTTGLYEHRAGSLRHSLDSILEQAEGCTPSADAIVRAVYALAHLTDDGKWINPPKSLDVNYHLAGCMCPRGSEGADSSGVTTNQPPVLKVDDVRFPGIPVPLGIGIGLPGSATTPGSTQLGSGLSATRSIKKRTQPAENKEHPKTLSATKSATSKPPISAPPNPPNSSPNEEHHE
jgi:hypothetical protein